MRSFIGLGAALGAATLLASTAVTGPVTAAPASYVALGDSYSSGTGTGSYLADGTTCLRSVYAYPSLVSAARGYDLNFRACSGATVADVGAAQVGALSASTSYVTLSVGGNDAGFADVLTECALPSWMSRCHRAIDAAQDFIAETLPGRLRGLYSDVRAAAPNARVVVVGYPRLFNGTDCNALTFFSGSEMRRLNRTANKLNARTSAEVTAAGFTFSNPTRRFRGHAVCDSPEWLNGLSFPIVESYHPNRAGHSDGYTPLVSPKLTGSQVVVGRATLSAARSSAHALADEQARYAAADARITPERVGVPDLSSKRARRAARRAGVDLDDPRSVRAADRRFARAQARAHRTGARR